jgi:hypothetical protein
MSPHDEQRFAQLISDFVEGCGFERPFHLVVIDARGTVSVTCYGVRDIEQVCTGPAKANRLKMIPPLTVTAISSDGLGKSAMITVEAERRRCSERDGSAALAMQVGEWLRLSCPHLRQAVVFDPSCRNPLDKRKRARQVWVMVPKTISYARVSILAFCAGAAVSFVTLPVWMAFVVNIAKEGSRTDWLGFIGTIFGSLVTGGVAAAAIYVAWRAVMRQSRLTLISREEDWIAARLPGLREAFELCDRVANARNFDRPYVFVRKLFGKDDLQFPFMFENLLPSVERLLPRTNDESRKTISLLFAEVNNAAYSAEAVAESNLEDMIDYQNNRVSDCSSSSGEL